MRSERLQSDPSIWGRRAKKKSPVSEIQTKASRYTSCGSNCSNNFSIPNAFLPLPSYHTPLPPHAPNAQLSSICLRVRLWMRSKT